MNTKNEIYEILRNSGYRITAQKKQLLEVLFTHKDIMLSIADIERYLPNEAIMNTTTIYRNVQQFLKLDIVESMMDDNGINRYILFHGSHHHHLICNECGKIIQFPCSHKFWAEIAKENNFKESSHKIEIYGTCSKCQKNR